MEIEAHWPWHYCSLHVLYLSRCYMPDAGRRYSL